MVHSRYRPHDCFVRSGTAGQRPQSWPTSGGWCPSSFDPADSLAKKNAETESRLEKRFTRIESLLQARRDGQDLKKET